MDNYGDLENSYDEKDIFNIPTTYDTNLLPAPVDNSPSHSPPPYTPQRGDEPFIYEDFFNQGVPLVIAEQFELTAEPHRSDSWYTDTRPTVPSLSWSGLPHAPEEPKDDGPEANTRRAAGSVVLLDTTSEVLSPPVVHQPYEARRPRSASPIRRTPASTTPYRARSRSGSRAEDGSDDMPAIPAVALPVHPAPARTLARRRGPLAKTVPMREADHIRALPEFQNGKSWRCTQCGRLRKNKKDSRRHYRELHGAYRVFDANPVDDP